MRRRMDDAVFVAALGLVIAACTSGVPESSERLRGEGRAVHQRIKLDGCMKPGRHAGEYVLDNVVEPPPATQPVGQDLMQSAPIVPKGGRARLTGDPDNLKKHLGQLVQVMGDVVDRGENTLGTSDRQASGAGEASDNPANTTRPPGLGPSIVPPDSALSNARRPLIAVERLTALASTCDGKPESPGPV